MICNHQVHCLTAQVCVHHQQRTARQLVNSFSTELKQQPRDTTHDLECFLDLGLRHGQDGCDLDVVPVLLVARELELLAVVLRFLQLRLGVRQEPLEELVHAFGAEAFALGDPEWTEDRRGPRLQTGVQHWRCNDGNPILPSPLML